MVVDEVLVGKAEVMEWGGEEEGEEKREILELVFIDNSYILLRDE